MMAVVIDLPFGFSLSLTWAIVILTIVLFVLYDAWCHSYWWRQGVAYVPARPLLGNLLDMAREGFINSLLRNGKKYESYYGIFDHREPILIVKDPEMIKRITVKNFSHFVNRKEAPLNNMELDHGVANLMSERWKEVRNVLTPAFSGSKMKHMSSLVNESIDTMMRNLDTAVNKDGTFETNSLFGSYVMDTVGRCAFGLDTDSQRNPDDPFVLHAKHAFDFNLADPGLIIVGLFPWMEPILKYFKFSIFPLDSIAFFKDVTLKTIALRKKNPQQAKTKDFLQLMMNTQEHAEDEMENVHEFDIHDDIDLKQGSSINSATVKKKTELTEAELVGAAGTFFLAGYETTKITLMFTSYALATTPEVQEKLIMEIDELLPTRDDVTYSNIAKMEYLDQVVSESLRLYPPAVLSDRVCNASFTYKNLTLVPGNRVFFNIIALHRDSNLWPDPETFDPERFTKENREERHPFAWIPFGAGPRMCLGMRFAMMEAKMALVRILQKYRFEKCPQTQIPPDISKSPPGFLRPAGGIALRVVQRTDI